MLSEEERRVGLEAWTELCWNGSPGYVRLAYKADDGEFKPHPYRSWPQDKERIITGLLAASQSRDWWAGICLHREPNGKKESAIPSRVAYADIDNPLNEAQTELLQNLGAGVVASGAEGHRQVYVPLTEAPSPDDLELLNRLLRDALGGDHKWDLSVVLRPACTWWRKGEWPAVSTDGKLNPHAGTEPRLVLWETLPGKAIAPDVLQGILSLPLAAAERASRNGGRGWIPKKDGSGEIDRSDSLYGVVSAALDAGMAMTEIVKAVVPLPMSAGFVAEGRLVSEVERCSQNYNKKRATTTTKSDAVVGVDGFAYTETGNADRLIASHGDRLRYVNKWLRWIVYDAPCWIDDPGAVRAQGLAKDIAHQLWEWLPKASGKDRKHLFRWAIKSESASTIGNSVRLARDLVLIEHDNIDGDQNLFACQNYIYNTKTQELLEHSPDRLIMKVSDARYDPTATAPKFERFLVDILPDPDVRAYVQRWAGYCLTGSCSEQVMNVWYGGGQNGKSTLIHILEAVLGPYAVTASSQLLIAQKYEPHPTIKMSLFRKRLATVIENNEGQRLNEALMKQLTGGDQISGRYMRENEWEFSPSHKFIMACNSKPVIEAMDFAMWRRIHLVPFTVTIPDESQIGDFDKLLVAEELSGILNWCIEGCKEWRCQGLNPPAVVIAATQSYKAESDTVTQFMAASNLEFFEAGRVDSGVLQTLHTEWCEEMGFIAMNHWQKVFKAFKDHGAENKRKTKERWWQGVRIKEQD